MQARAAARLVALALLCAGAGNAHAGAADAHSPGALLAKYGALQDKLRHNQFHRPLTLDSSETADGVAGDVYALVDYPFATVGAALNSPGNWCDILTLHHNIKYCRASAAGEEARLDVGIGRKYDQPPDKAYRVLFAYRVAARTPNYLRVRLNADAGPFATRNYRIVFEAVALQKGQTFIHLSYSYDYGFLGRLAMQAYLATIGRDKVGFTLAGTQPDGQSRYIGGMRGAVERNAMRYCLAIEAFLGALSEPPQAQFEKRLHDWFAAIERYPRQLHEMDQGAYLEMKRRATRQEMRQSADTLSEEPIMLHTVLERTARDLIARQP
jgi:hypothetical protein